ncbi:MAG TPA: sugar phosphate nucleotidyltransferase [Pyrinomonadaceae bacterium]|nr:sugar phosphate nucleotidyltransferase [Pyrinomonadaceae bacterium]
MLLDSFSNLYGDGEVSLLRAPARIGILGEHIDYVSYLPTASLTFGSRERDALMLYRASTTSEIRGSSTDERFRSADFSLDNIALPSLANHAEKPWLDYLFQQGTPPPHWMNYVKGSVYFALGKFENSIVNGFDFALDSNIPAGGGASSSSALVVLAGAAIRNVNHIKFTPDELANDSALAEWFVGTRGGSMDHRTICSAQPAHAVLINYATGEASLTALPDEPFQWITFFTKPADKGREIMIEYNERAAVSRILIPAIIENWRQTHLERHSLWNKSLDSLTRGFTTSLETCEAILRQLPETINHDELARDYPSAFSELQRSFPALVSEKSRWPLKLKARALHHLGEVKRVAKAASTLKSLTQDSTSEAKLIAMRTIGTLLNESHAGLRDLYDVSTEEVEGLISIIRTDPHVLGARLMGGGFGGNVLALTTQSNAHTLIERVQEQYYAAQNRNGVDEGSVMVSTPGPGLANVDPNQLWRESISHINTLGNRAANYANNIRVILDSLPDEQSSVDVWPVIVAAGKGTRATASGLNVPKPIASVCSKPAIVQVLHNIRAALGIARSPIIIVSPETEMAVREAVTEEHVTFVVQPEALGTGDAVLAAYKTMADFNGRTLVVWGTQPVIQEKTYSRAVKLATLFDSYQMVLPTTFKHRPYAPITRRANGDVQSAFETHLERATPIELGETNIGLFLLHNQAMFDVLLNLRKTFWNAARGQYNRPSGELGFPNELITAFAQQENGVFASPFADGREEQGVKQLDDVSRCEQFIRELQRENSTDEGR